MHLSIACTFLKQIYLHFCDSHQFDICFGMSNKRCAILKLFQQGNRKCDIDRLLGIPKQTVSDATRRFNELSHEGDRPDEADHAPLTLPEFARS